MISAARPSQQVFFADTGAGRHFAIASTPSGTPRGAVLFIHPFAEEMNKSRRMVSLAARALARDGWLVLRFDLHGCGDSEGDFGDASWDGWLADISFWWAWLNEKVPGPTLIWGLRAGALLATEWVQKNQIVCPLLLWQPVINGQQHLIQFLRLRAASEMLDARQERGVVTGLRSELAAGLPVTVAGYRVSTALGVPMSEARMTLPNGFDQPITIIEIVARADTTPTPAIVALTDKWQETGIPASLSTCVGPGFWRTVEIESVPALIDATLKMASDMVG